jgi:antitoxin component YwqK of YwqJK toxin-antitoxin module
MEMFYPEVNIANDKQDGPWVYFNEDGSVLETGSYKNGVKTGPWLNLLTDLQLIINWLFFNKLLTIAFVF